MALLTENITFICERILSQKLFKLTYALVDSTKSPAIFDQFNNNNNNNNNNSNNKNNKNNIDSEFVQLDKF